MFTTKNNTYIITELCKGDLNKVIKSRKKLSEREGYKYLVEIIDAYSHIY